MNLSRRNEPFRYAFSTPAECLFEIIEINGNFVSSKMAKAYVSNISRSGCSLTSTLNLNAVDHRIQIRIHFDFLDTPLITRGELRWQRALESCYAYGIQLNLEDSDQDVILLALRTLAASKRIKAI